MKVKLMAWLGVKMAQALSTVSRYFERMVWVASATLCPRISPVE
eukprot:CAMPEP_0177756578 /NCGR_PEP_ID=MMETSP0491_2-20121128/3185_1 /TAXON_ID=63592 /ORGANISM="Tetraselmis chuii, Strain PLY429" /LENGTH=43 /DNA_ID= /DNA_START= /DNA_END= /DNA_ORIENTATION=